MKRKGLQGFALLSLTDKGNMLARLGSGSKPFSKHENLLCLND